MFHDAGMPSGTGTVREYASIAMTTHDTASTVQPLPIVDAMTHNWKSCIQESLTIGKVFGITNENTLTEFF